MRKFCNVLTIVFVSLAMFPTFIVPAIAETLRIGISGDYPPFMSTDDAGRITGIDAELLEEICARGAFECVYERMELSTLISAVVRGDIDLAASGIGTNYERDQVIDFTCPYALYNNYVSAVWSLNPNTKIKSARIAVVQGSLHEKVLLQMGLNGVAFSDDREAMAAVRNGNADAYFSGGEFATGARGLVVIDELEIGRTGAAFVVSESNPALRETINGILSQISAEGIIGRAQERWLGFNQGDVIADCDTSMVFS